MHIKGLLIVLYQFLSRIKSQGHYDLDKFLILKIFLHTVYNSWLKVQVDNAYCVYAMCPRMMPGIIDLTLT